MSRRLLLSLTALAALGCAGLLGPTTPEGTVERWLRLGEQGDVDAARDLLEPGCTKSWALNVLPTHVMGARMTLDRVAVATMEQTDDTARVHYEVHGAIHGDEPVEMNLGSLSFKVNDMNMEDITRTGEVQLKRDGVSWQIVCGSAPGL